MYCPLSPGRGRFGGIHSVADRSSCAVVVADAPPSESLSLVLDPVKNRAEETKHGNRLVSPLVAILLLAVNVRTRIAETDHIAIEADMVNVGSFDNTSVVVVVVLLL